MTQYTKPAVLPAWGESAGGADVLQPTNAEIQAGWPLSNVPPSRKRFNWILKYLSQGVRYLMQMGIPVWDSTEDYPVNARVLGSDGKTYKAILASTNQNPTSQPTYWTRWGFTLAEIDAEGTTPAQFDNSVKRASTAFVKQAGLQFSTSITKALPLTLVASDLGSSIYLSGSGAVTLPASATCPSGCVLSLFNTTLNAVTVTRAGADQIAVNGGSYVTGIVLQAGESLQLVSNSASPWFAIGGTGCNQFAGSFKSSLGTTGYQKLPNGLILQWVTPIYPTSGAITWTFPIAFPTATISVWGGVSPGSAVDFAGRTIGTYNYTSTMAQFTVALSGGAAPNGTGCQLFALGY